MIKRITAALMALVMILLLIPVLPVNTSATAPTDSTDPAVYQIGDDIWVVGIETVPDAPTVSGGVWERVCIEGTNTQESRPGTCPLEEHAHTVACYDTYGNPTCGCEVHKHNIRCATYATVNYAEYRWMVVLAQTPEEDPSEPELSETVPATEVPSGDNEDGSTSLYVHNVDVDGNNLEGAVFFLFAPKADGGGAELKGRVKTDENGIARFEGLRLSGDANRETWTLAQNALSGDLGDRYKTNGNKWLVTIVRNEDGSHRLESVTNADASVETEYDKTTRTVTVVNEPLRGKIILNVVFEGLGSTVSEEIRATVTVTGPDDYQKIIKFPVNSTGFYIQSWTLDEVGMGAYHVAVTDPIPVDGMKADAVIQIQSPVDADPVTESSITLNKSHTSALVTITYQYTPADSTTDPSTDPTTEPTTDPSVEPLVYPIGYRDMWVVGIETVPDQQTEPGGVWARVCIEGTNTQESRSRSCPIEVHSHTMANCYDVDGRLNCGLDEHEHNARCQTEAALYLTEYRWEVVSANNSETDPPPETTEPLETTEPATEPTEPATEPTEPKETTKPTEAPEPTTKPNTGSNGSSSSGSNTISNSNTIIVKVVDDLNRALENTEIGLFDDSGVVRTWSASYDNVFILDDLEDLVGDGQSATYTLQQTRSVAGYNLSTNSFTVTIVNNNGQSRVEIKEKAGSLSKLLKGSNVEIGTDGKQIATFINERKTTQIVLNCDVLVDFTEGTWQDDELVKEYQKVQYEFTLAWEDASGEQQEETVKLTGGSSEILKATLPFGTDYKLTASAENALFRTTFSENFEGTVSAGQLVGNIEINATQVYTIEAGEPLTVSMVKVDADTKRPLEGVKFLLKNEADEELQEYVSGETGEIEIVDVLTAPGTYTLEETETLAGYELLRTPVQIDVAVQYSSNSESDAASQIQTMTAVVTSDVTVEESDGSYWIENSVANETSDKKSRGLGTGAIIGIAAVGVAGVSGAAVFVLRRKRKKG